MTDSIFSISQPRLGRSGITFVLVLATSVAALGGLLFGFDTAVIAGTTHALTNYFYLTPATLGTTVSCALWGTLGGCLFAALPAERLGTRESLRLVGLLYLVSAVGCALSHRWVLFLLFRLLGGVAIGGCSVFAPMYIAELSPAALRGKLVACFQLSIVLGILAAYGSNAVISSLHLGANEWRAELGVAGFPSLLFFLALGVIPRNPRWLIRQGRQQEALETLTRIGVQDPVGERTRIAAGLSTAASAAAGSSSLRLPGFRRPLLIALALGLFNQFSGINAILYYLNDIFADAGFTAVSASQQAVAVGVANLVFTIAGMALIDRIGRKPLLLAGAAGMAVTLAGVTAVLAEHSYQSLLLPLLVIFIAFFAVSQGVVVWVYLSEIFPAAVREPGQSFASFWLWLLTAIVAQAFPQAAAVSKAGTFLFFCLAMLVQFFVVLSFFPETRGRSLDRSGMVA